MTEKTYQNTEAEETIRDGNNLVEGLQRLATEALEIKIRHHLDKAMMAVFDFQNTLGAEVPDIEVEFVSGTTEDKSDAKVCIFSVRDVNYADYMADVDRRREAGEITGEPRH